jgi:hypothetical protein
VTFQSEVAICFSQSSGNAQIFSSNKRKRGKKRFLKMSWQIDSAVTCDVPRLRIKTDDLLLSDQFCEVFLMTVDGSRNGLTA